MRFVPLDCSVLVVDSVRKVPETDRSVSDDQVFDLTLE